MPIKLAAIPCVNRSVCSKFTKILASLMKPELYYMNANDARNHKKSIDYRKISIKMSQRS